MKHSVTISIAALILIVIMLPVYLYLEPVRLANAQADLQVAQVAEAAAIYIESCALCHGTAGEGTPAAPALDALAAMDEAELYKVVARGRYNTAMTGWLQEEGGPLTAYQLAEMVTFLLNVEWPDVRELAAQGGVVVPTTSAPIVDEAYLAELLLLGESGSQWAQGVQLYAANCTACHGIEGQGTALAPALNTPDLRALDADVLNIIITSGVTGTAMGAWQDNLTPQEIDSLVAFLLNWDAVTEKGLVLAAPPAVHVDPENPQQMASLGEQLFSTICSSCHGEEGSGGSGPALNSQQMLTRLTDQQIASTITNGPARRNSTMPAFGEQFTALEIEALVAYIRGWQPTAEWVANPRGSAQGGPPTGTGGGAAGGKGGGPPWRR